MKTKMAIGLLLLSKFAIAQDIRVKVEDFSFSYDDPRGYGEATNFQHNQRTLAGVRVEVEKLGEALSFKVSGAENQEFRLEKAPEFLTKARTMVVDDLDLTYEDSLSFSILEGEFIGDDELRLKNFTLNCNKDLSETKAEDQLISGCLKRMAVKSQSFSQESLEAGFVSAFTSALGKAAGSRGNLSIKALDLKIIDGKYDLGADIKAQMSGRAKSNGTMSYDKTAGKLTVKISEVKFGLLNVTGMVFDELKKNESDHMKVQKPHVILTIK